MKKFTALIAVLLICGLCGCSNNGNNTPPVSETGKTTAENTATSTQATTETSSIKTTSDELITTNSQTTSTVPVVEPDVPLEDDGITTVVFIGNSLTSTPFTFWYLKGISEREGKVVNTVSLTQGGASIDDVYDVAVYYGKNNKPKADCVIIQDLYLRSWAFNGMYAADYYKEYDKRLSEIVSAYSSETKFYIYGPWNDGYDDQSIDKLVLLDYTYNGFQYIPLPYAAWKTSENEKNVLSDEITHKYDKNDTHPNELFGYLLGNMIYETIFGEETSDIYLDLLDSEMYERIPADTEKEKIELMRNTIKANRKYQKQFYDMYVN